MYDDIRIDLFLLLTFVVVQLVDAMQSQGARLDKDDKNKNRPKSGYYTNNKSKAMQISLGKCFLSILEFL